MIIDVVRYGSESVVSLASVTGITKFKKDYSHWFCKHSTIYIRYVGKNSIGSWRELPNKSTDFYRCPKVSQDLIEKLNRDFITSVIQIYDKGVNNAKQ